LDIGLNRGEISGNFFAFSLFTFSPFPLVPQGFFMRLGFHLSIAGSLRRAVYQNGAWKAP
jgi:hypothetical protein